MLRPPRRDEQPTRTYMLHRNLIAHLVEAVQPARQHEPSTEHLLPIWQPKQLLNRLRVLCVLAKLARSP